VCNFKVHILNEKPRTQAGAFKSKCCSVCLCLYGNKYWQLIIFGHLFWWNFLNPIWPFHLTPWPNQFIYPIRWVTMSNLIKICQLTKEILRSQVFSNRTSYCLDLWPHDHEYSVHLSFMVSHLVKFDEAPSTWPWPLTPWSWIPNQFMYSSQGVTLSSLMKIHQLPREISCPQIFSNMTPYYLDLWPHDPEYLISSSNLHGELPWWRASNSLGSYRAHKVVLWIGRHIDRRTHRQNKNIMPPDTTGSGRRHNNNWF